MRKQTQVDLRDVLCYCYHDLAQRKGLCINCISDPGRLERDPCYSGMMICNMTHCGPMQIVNNENLLDNVPRLQSFLANQRQTFIDMH